jgi:hypothetical protein
MSHEESQSARCMKALDAFRKQYPSISIGDIQTFILAFKVGEESMLEEAKTMLLACFMFSGANGGQGLGKVSGNNFGEQVKTVVDAQLTNNNAQSVISTIAKLIK